MHFLAEALVVMIILGEAMESILGRLGCPLQRLLVVQIVSTLDAFNLPLRCQLGC